MCFLFKISFINAKICVYGDAFTSEVFETGYSSGFKSNVQLVFLLSACIT